MDVDAAIGGNIQHLLRQDPSIGNHGADIRLQSPQLLHRFLLAEGLRLEHRDFMFQSDLFHRGIYHFHTPSLGTVRLGIHTHNIKAISQNLLQTGRRNIRRSHKYHSQGRFLQK